jgi:hypothetical protein
MTLYVSRGRPLARLVVRAANALHPVSASWPVPRYSPPAPEPAPPSAHHGPEHERVDLAEAVLHGLLSALPEEAEPISDADRVLAPDVVVWSPTVYATTREEVLSALCPGHEMDNALTDVQVEVLAADPVGARVYLEWRLTARFANPCLIDDDLLVEPTGRLVETSGVQVATFDAGRLVSVHCYYDDLALLEQLVT